MLTDRLAILDLETTGADPREDRITEIGLMLVDGGQVTEEWSTLVNPGRHIPPGIESLTGISDRMVERAPRFPEVAHDLAQRLQARLLIAHNARFDYAFLRNEFRRASLAFSAGVLCTVRLSRRLDPHEPRHNLDALVERHGLASDGRHRALADARLVRRLLTALESAVGAAALDAAAREVSSDAAGLPELPAGLDDLPDTPGIYLLYDSAGQPLYAGKAANLRTQILSHYAETGARGRAQRAALQAGALDWTCTAGEFGAALRHLAVVQQRRPSQNRRLRDHGSAWALRWQPQAVPQVAPVPLDEHGDGELFGPFRTRADALAALRGLAREHLLCHTLIGLSAAGTCPPEAACRGACDGRESRAVHMLRMIQALARLRLPAWPFAGAIALVEEDRGRTRAELHLADAWRYLGSAAAPSDLPALQAAPNAAGFDVDVYRLLRRALESPARIRVIDLSRQRAAEIEWAF